MVSGALRGAARGWDRFWFGEISPYRVGAFRILFGIYLLAYFGTRAFHVDVLFARGGVYSPFLISDLALPSGWAQLLYGIFLAAICCMIAGIRARISVPAVFGFYLYYYLLNLAVKNTAYDRLNLLFLFFLLFARSGSAWAVSTRSAGGDNSPRAWPVRLICLQLTLLYLGAGLWKAVNPTWHLGELLRMTFVGPWGTPLGFWFVGLGWPDWFYTASVWAVIIFELGLGFALWIPKIQKPAMVAGFLFHLSIGLMVNIPEFLNCAAVYVLFLPGDQVKRAGEKVGGLVWLRRRERQLLK